MACTRACVRAYRNEIDTSSFDDFLRNDNLGKKGGSPPKGGCYLHHHENNARLLDRLCTYVRNHVTIVCSVFMYVNAIVIRI